MTHRLCAVLIALLLVTLFSCAHKTERADNEGRHAVMPPRATSVPVAPNRCRLICTLVNADTIDFSPAMTCRVRIDSVLGYGSSFGMPLYPGGMITLRIASIADAQSPADASADRTLPGGTMHPIRITSGTVLGGDVERNSVDENGGGSDFSMIDAAIRSR